MASVEWTITSWNIHGKDDPDIATVADALRSESPDVVVIQEARRRQTEQIAAALEMRFTWALKHYPYTKLFSSRAEGMAILTPHALDAAGHTELTRGTFRDPWRRRIAQWALVGRADRSAYRIYNLHLSPEALSATATASVRRSSVSASGERCRL